MSELFVSIAGSGEAWKINREVPVFHGFEMIGVAEWQTKLGQSLPEPLRSNLPTVEQIENELCNET